MRCRSTANTAVRHGRSLRQVAAFVVAVSLAAATSVRADTTGRINAVAGAPIPSGIAIAVAATDASGRAGVVQPEIEGALQARGHVIDPDSPWQLQFSTAVDEVRRDRSLFRLMGRIGSESRPDVGVEVPLPQWPGPASADTVYRYNVSMTFGRSGRPAIWQGAATAIRPDRDSLATDRDLAAALLARFGETVADQPLPIP